MPWTNPPPTGKQKASGATNPVRVRCSKCGTSQFIKASNNGFICGTCGHRHK